MMPQMSDAMRGLETPLRYELIQRKIVDHESVDGDRPQPPIFVEGSLQPLNPRKLLVKPEGERSWKWWVFVTESPLKLDDVLRDDEGRTFRVMSQADWASSRFYRYELREGPAL